MSETTTDAMADNFERTLDAVERACEIIETGDRRLLASDGPAGGQPPAITLDEWREMYAALDSVRGFGEICDMCRRRWWSHTPQEAEFCALASADLEGRADAASY